MMKVYKEDFSDLLYNDTDIIPKIGNFYFIANTFIRESLTFDYNYFMKIGGIRLLKTDKCKSIEFWNAMKYFCYPWHTEKSYNNNLFYLEFIAIHGWTEFVIKYNNILAFGKS